MRTSEIAEFLSAELVGDGDVEIRGVSALETAGAGELAFVDNAQSDISSSASALIVRVDHGLPSNVPLIKTRDPKYAFARIAALLHAPDKPTAERHSTSIVNDTATIAEDVTLGSFTCVGSNSAVGAGTQLQTGTRIGKGVTIGRNCVLHPNVIIEDNCTIGDAVILHAGVVIGADGFGYVGNAEGYIKFPQIGTVVIEDDVEIGANTCVDRGALGETRIGKGTKIDNLVQIAHNVRIGERVVIAAQTGISGSTVVEDDCVIGGQVGMGDHARVLKGAVIGSQAGVLPGKIVRAGVWWGTPVQPLDEYKRQNAHVKGLERLKADIRDLKTKVDGLLSRFK